MILDATGEPLRLSASKIIDAESCMRMFKLKHIDLLSDERPNHHLSFGTTMHAVMEKIHAQPVMPGPSQVLEWYEQSWVPEDYRKYIEQGMETWQALGYESQSMANEWRIMGVDMLMDYLKAIEGRFVQAAHIETYFRLPFDRGYDISGRIDRVDKLDNGKIRIIDYKTSQKIKSGKELEEDIQLAIYWWAAKEVFGLTDDDIEDVGLYFLRFNEYHSVTFDQFTIGAIFSRITDVIDRIESGWFDATPSWKCKYCDVADICKRVS